MAISGQTSDAWYGAASSVFPWFKGTANSWGKLTEDAFTQTNPSAVSTNVSTQADVYKFGVLSGSVAFARPDAGSDFHGGPGSAAIQTALRANASHAVGFRPLGVYQLHAAGNAFENTPAVASGKNTYYSAQGTYGNSLYESHLIAQVDANQAPAGDAITYHAGQELVASRNGFLMPRRIIGRNGAAFSADLVALTAESFVDNQGGGAGANARATVIAVLKMPPDAQMNQLVYDQRL